MRERKLLFCILTVVLVCFIIYTGIEIAVRGLDLPDPELIRSIDRELASADRIKGYFDWEAPVYGWGQDLTVDLSSDPGSSRSEKTYTVLFMGDSVTRGYKVDVSKESYPVLLFNALAKNMNVRVLNMAVQGFGVDQMILKLEESVPKYRPALIVFAYIPDDLRRPARNINYGFTKPVMVANRSKNWKLIPAPDIREFYNDYSNAKRRLCLSLWSLRHLVINRRYYFPQLYKNYYQSLFEEIRGRLISLAKQYDAKILVVRLASTWPGAPVPSLDRAARDTFTVPSEPEHFYYFDSEGCVRAKSAVLGINYAEEFMYHPSPTGHKIYADCLVDPLRAVLFSPSHGATH